MDHQSRLPQIRPVPQYLPGQDLLAQQSLASVGIPLETESYLVDLKQYWQVVVKYRLLLSAVVAICALASLIFAFTATPLYTASSKIRISTYEPILTATKIEDLLQQKSKENTYLETQVEELKSLSLADKVLQEAAIRDAVAPKRSKGFLSGLFDSDLLEGTPSDQVGGYTSSAKLLKRYLGQIEIRPVRRTSLVVIEATNEDPNISALMANKHALAYVDWVRNARVEQQARGLAFLRSQGDELRQKVADLDRQLADYAEANAIVAVNKDENITAQKMSQLNRLLTDATAKRIEAEHAFQEAQNALSKDSAGYDDQSTQLIRSELAKLEAEYGQLTTKFTPQYPRVQQLASQIQDLRRALQAQRRQITEGLRARFLATQEEEKTLKEELEQQKSKTFELAKSEVQYNVLNRELTASREMLQNVTRQIKETSLAVEGNSSNISVVDYATVPKMPSYPRKSFMLAIGIMSGLGLGLGLAFLLSYLDDTIRTPEQVAATLQIPTLGIVPSFSAEEAIRSRQAKRPGLIGLRAEIERETVPSSSAGPSGESGGSGLPSVSSFGSTGSLPIAFLADPQSLAAEAYRTIRTGILLSQAGQPPRTILISSAQSSEGKTTSSINLAACLASSGGRVVLVDADLRRPSVHKQLGLGSNLLGVVDVLTGQRTVEEVLINDAIKRISVLPAGRIPPNPAELLGSAEMAKLLDELAARFDYVLIDSPPVLPVTDSVILSRYVDGVVLVVKGAATPRKVVKDAKNRLQSVGARFLGTILNDVDVRSGDYYYYNKYYYSYYHEDQKAQAAAGRTG